MDLHASVRLLLFLSTEEVLELGINAYSMYTKDTVVLDADTLSKQPHCLRLRERRQMEVAQREITLHSRVKERKRKDKYKRWRRKESKLEGF